MTSKFSIPRSRIPKISAICIKCGSGTRTAMSQPFADGYHRRHLCRNIKCDYSFYSLTPYNGREAKVAPLPFHDRPLSLAEENQRMKWWAEEVENSQVSMPVVTTQGNDKPGVDPKLATIKRIAIAILKPKEARTQTEEFLADMHSVIENELEQMDAQEKEENNVQDCRREQQ